MVSTGGLEPPQLSPHAPQACVSTIPPHRLVFYLYQTFYLIVKPSPYRLCGGCCFQQPSPRTILNRPRRQSTTSTGILFISNFLFNCQTFTIPSLWRKFSLSLKPSRSIFTRALRLALNATVPNQIEKRGFRLWFVNSRLAGSWLCSACTTSTYLISNGSCLYTYYYKNFKKSIFI